MVHRVWTHGRSQSHASGNQKVVALRSCSHHAKLALRDEVGEIIDLLFCAWLFLVLRLVSSHIQSGLSDEIPDFLRTDRLALSLYQCLSKTSCRSIVFAVLF